MQRPISGVACLPLGCLLALGCGQSGPYPMVKVTGQVLYEDGQAIPADSIRIRFDSLEPPRDEKTHPRPGMATAGSDGNFDVVTTNQYADGVIRGRHKVKVSASDASGRPLVPELYSGSGSPLEIDTSDSPLTIRVPHP